MMYKSWQVPEGFLTLDGDEEYLLPPARRRQYIDDPVVRFLIMMVKWGLENNIVI